MKTTKKKTEKVDPFADTLQVRRICSGDTEAKKEQPKPEKLTKNTSKKKSDLPDYERRKTGADIGKTGLKYFLPDRKKMSNISGVPEKISIPRQLKRAPLGSEIKMISVNLPRFGRGQAVINSNIKDEYDYEESYNGSFQEKRPERLMDTFNYDQPTNVLEDAQKEIDISQNQLQKIHTILKNRNSEDSYSLKPKWKIPPSKTGSKLNGKERVISTLTNLNKKLNDMQEKYFSGTRSTYKSIHDFPNKITQSISEVEIDDSNSDFNLQLQNKEEILKRFDLSKRFQKVNSEEKGTYFNELERRNLGNSTEQTSMINLTESNSNCILPSEAKNRILEKFHLTKIQRMQDSVHRFGKRLSDKGQNFSTTIPDVILRDNYSSSDMNELTAKNSEQNYEMFDDSSEMDFIQDPRKDVDNMLDSKLIDGGSLKNELPEDDVEKFRELLLTQEARSSEKMKAGKSLSFLLPNENNKASLHELVPLGSKKQTVDALNSKSSETHYFDCDSKKENTSTTSTASNKKIFYDNFGRYSYLIEKREGRNPAANSVPNLSSNKFATNETMTRSDKEIFDNTPLQDAVLKSDYLTKTFEIDSSGNFSESHSNQITKNKSDQFFNGLDFKNLDGKNVKGSKMNKDMYMTLSKALSNSFYKLSPQK